MFCKLYGRCHYLFVYIYHIYLLRIILFNLLSSHGGSDFLIFTILFLPMPLATNVRDNNVF